MMVAHSPEGKGPATGRDQACGRGTRMGHRRARTSGGQSTSAILDLRPCACSARRKPRGASRTLVAKDQERHVVLRLAPGPDRLEQLLLDAGDRFVTDTLQGGAEALDAELLAADVAHLG